MPRELGIIEETMRDGQLSLWATRMSTEDMLSIARVVDRAGFIRACTSSGAGFDTAVKFLRENPWERCRLVKAEMPNTPLMILVRGRNLFGWRQFPDDIVDLLMKCVAEVGFEWILQIDGLNDFSNVAYHIASAHRHGLKVDAALCYTISPVHPDELFLAKTRELVELGADAVTFYDASGLLAPERAAALIPEMKWITGNDVPLQLNIHDSTGLALACCREGIRLGIDAICTSSDALARGASIPATADALATARELGVSTAVDEALVPIIDDYFHWIAARHGHAVPGTVTFEREAYERYIGHQVPGGMMSNFERQLSEAGIIERMPLILDEVARVRAEMGYPLMITPYSQMVGVQAVLNVMSGERYASVPSELPRYACGYYGEVPGEVDPEIYARIVPDEPTGHPDFTAPDPELARLRAAHPELSDQDLLLRLFFGESTMDTYESEPRDPDPALIAKSPLTELVKEVLVRRGDTRQFTLRTNGAPEEGRALNYADVTSTAAYLDAAPEAAALEVIHGGLELSVAR